MPRWVAIGSQRTPLLTKRIRPTRCARRVVGLGCSNSNLGASHPPARPRLPTRRCSKCAKKHDGAASLATNMRHKRCESCNLKQPNFGLAREKRRRWCFGCARKHDGAVNLTRLQPDGSMTTGRYVSKAKRAAVAVANAAPVPPPPPMAAIAPADAHLPPMAVVAPAHKRARVTPQSVLI